MGNRMGQAMKIMVISTLYPPNLLGGAEKSVALISEGLAARGHQVAILTLHDQSVETDTVERGVMVHRRRLRNFYWPYPSDDGRAVLPRIAFHMLDSLNVFMARTVGETLRRHRCDIVLSNQLSSFSVLAWRSAHQAGIPILHSLRDFYLLCPKSTMFREGKPCARQCLDCRVFAYPRKAMSQYVNGVTGVSQYMIDRHRTAGLFRNALSLPSILSAVRVPASVSPRLSAAPEPVRHFGFIGRIQPEKGLDLLLDGLLTLPRDCWRLLIAGHCCPAYLAHLQRRCADLPVSFLGFVPDTDFYAAVDVVVVPSIWEEPQPRTVLEAFAHGLTVIASARGGIPELVKHGHNGYLVDLDHPEELAHALSRAVYHPMEGRAYGENGRRSVAVRTEATLARDYELACRQVIEA